MNSMRKWGMPQMKLKERDMSYYETMKFVEKSIISRKEICPSMKK